MDEKDLNKAWSDVQDIAAEYRTQVLVSSSLDNCKKNARHGCLISDLDYENPL